jgi:hypothetical protein
MHSGALTHIEHNGADKTAPKLSGWERFANEARRVLSGEGAIRARKARLIEEHRDLDDLIGVLAYAPASDDALISRLKKRKLCLRDEIARADAQLVAHPERAPP